jgi:protein PET117
MHQGVLRDDARRAAKLREREEALEASRERQQVYERVQKVAKKES